MADTFQQVIPHMLAHEGGYVDHPKDPGGATNKGVTIANFRRYVKPNGTKADLKKLTTAQAATVFKRFYWDRIQGDSLPAGVDYATGDFAVNSGPVRAAKYLQAVVGAVQDGVIGPATIAACERRDPVAIINSLCDARLAFMKRIRKGALWKTFGKGWQRRVDDVRRISLDLTKPRPIERKPINVPKPVMEEALRRDESKTIKAADDIKSKGWLEKLTAGIPVIGPALGYFADVDKIVLVVVAVLAAGFIVWRLHRKDKAADRIIDARVQDQLDGSHIGRPNANLAAAVGAVRNV